MSRAGDPTKGRCPFHAAMAGADGGRTPGPGVQALRAGRRGVLLGLAGFGAAAGRAGAEPAPLMQEPPGRDAGAAGQAIAFHGAHQPGILNPPPAAALVAAFDVLAPDRAALEGLFRTLTARIRFLMAGGTPPEEDPRFPPVDSGILGPRVVPDALTLTVAVGASLFDGRYGLAERRPRRLQTMARFPNDALERDRCHGDLLLQICANTPQAVLHALRDVVKNTPATLRLRWMQDGFLPEAKTPEHAPGQARETPRNLLGFRDGTANPDPTDAAEMARIVWIRPGDEEGDEPAWTAGGTYQVVRLIRNFVERWDRTPLGEQEAIIGRHKNTGAPLGLADEHALPDYADDPEGQRTRLDAHIRLANPRDAAAASSLILRRPFNYARGVTRAGQLDMGLLFICFQRDLEAGFITVQRRLDGEPLEEYIKPTGGGYFFALPGVTGPDDFLARALLAG
ncbi:iron uptake transporter deferrochelatase/peroxidase subunit [Roseomonas elaeocarpi]|uniref:Deferrochelatase n=1 Tax=Roseomonas elaeocarpi TaxID=907779 RepID=A0ABV6JNH1_9PROT